MARNNGNAQDEEPLVLIVPGLNDSGPGHWQSLWEQEIPGSRRVELGMWDNPHRNTWVNQINLAIHRADRPVVLVAHSLGCHAVAWWAEYEQPAHDHPVAAALLVAPADVEAKGADPRLARFAPLVSRQLPFASIVAASRDDPFASFGQSKRFARKWGSRLVDVGPLGHINASSGIGNWPYGKYLLNQLIASVSAPRAPLLAGRAAATMQQYEQQGLVIGR
ncbi:MAG: alpha/beta hydrolase [Sphingomonadales bacterium]|nr:alpha/beta hydrolase [Sphingomonadales bacterium]